MRKEIIIAIFIGLAFGAVIAFGVRTARESLANRPKTISESSSTTTQTTENNQTILITTPEPNEIVSEKELNVIGTTTPKSLISVQTTTGEAVVMADEAGAFNAVIQLESGINPINITSFSPEGDKSTVKLVTVYSTVDFTATESAKEKTQ